VSLSPNDVVLVTGGAGFIGSALSHKLAGKVGRVVAVDVLHPQVHPSGRRPASLHEDTELVIGDVTDSAMWDSLLADMAPSVVIHLAAETGTGQSLREASRHASVNVVGTTEMLDAFTRAGQVPAHIILSSSRAVYGEGQWVAPDGTPFSPGQRSHEQLERGEWDFGGATSLPNRALVTPPAPTSVYGATKLAQEHILSAWTAALGNRLTILRLQNVYGPGQSLINAYTGIVSLFSQLAEAGQSIPIYEDGNITRDFVFIEDVADAFVAALQTDEVQGPRLFDVGSGVATTVLELGGELARYYSAPAPHITGQYRDGDVRHAACDIERTVRELPWAPQWSLERGLIALQAWIAEQSERIG